MKLRMAKADLRPMTEGEIARFDTACIFAEQAADSFTEQDYKAASYWWIKAAEVANDIPAKKACIENAMLAWSLIRTQRERVH